MRYILLKAIINRVERFILDVRFCMHRKHALYVLEMNDKTNPGNRRHEIDTEITCQFQI